MCAVAPDRAPHAPRAALAALLLEMLAGSGHVLAQAPADKPADLHTWKDTTGRFQVQARYVAIEGDKVTLQKPDGTQLEVPLARLSPADQEFAAAQQKLAAEAEDPFQPKASGAMPAPGGTAPDAAAPAPGGPPRLIEADWSSAPAAALPPPGEWQVNVPASPAPAAAAAEAPRLRPILLPPTSDFFEKRKGIVLNAAGTRAVVGYTLEKPGGNSATSTRLVLCDLQAGKVLGAARTDGLMAPLALADDASAILMRRDEFGFGKSDRLELWHLTPRGIERTWQCIPYAAEPNEGDRDLKWAAFLGPDRFATLSSKGRLALWDLKSIRPTLTLELAGGSVPALSPDGKILAFAADQQFGLLDLDAGQVVALGAMPAAHMPWPLMMFSPSGKRIACAAGGKLFVWDTATGTLDREIQLTPLIASPQNASAWTDDDHILIADHFLLDVASQVKLWNYQGYDAFQPARDGTLWFATQSFPNQQSALVPARLPHPAALNALTQALADPGFFILKDGSTVALDPSGIPDTSQRAGVVESLTRRLAAMNVKVAPEAPLVLRLAIEPGKEEEVTYRSMGSFQTNTFKVHPQISKLTFLYQNVSAWEAASSSVPMVDFAHLGKDESLADHVRKFDLPNYGYFDSVELPRLLTRPNPQAPGGVATLGQSQVTPTGVR